MGNDNITITLRPFNVSDAEDFWLLANSDDSVIRSFNLESRYVNVIITFDEWPGFKAKLWGHPGFKAICLNNKPIGVFLMSTQQAILVGVELHWVVLCTEATGAKGSTRAVNMVSNTTFDEWPHLERLEAFSEVDNLASQKVLLRSGFKKEGVLRKYSIIQEKATDVVIFSLLFTDIERQIQIRAKL